MNVENRSIQWWNALTTYEMEQYWNACNFTGEPGSRQADVLHIYMNIYLVHGRGK